MTRKKEKESTDFILKTLDEHNDRLNAIEKKLDNIVKLMNFYTPIIKQLSHNLKDTKIENVDVPKSILVVDDDPNIVHTLKLILEGSGYSVDSAPNAMEALRKAKRLHFDLVIVDMNLPDTLGDELVQRLYEMNDKIKVIMITGYSSYKEKLEKSDIEMDVLTKPLSPDKLLAIIGKKLQKNS
jgi:CheY-like chemotaxis protein